MSRITHDTRLQSREDQSRVMSGGPIALPVFDIPTLTDHRQRLEWDTQNTLNQRLWANTVSSGSKNITPEMLSIHPTNGAYNMTPSASRGDNRIYHGFGKTSSSSYFPDSAPPFKDGMPKDRPTLPPKDIIRNPWFANLNIDDGDVTRELRGVVQENNRFLTADSSARVATRTFEHQWIPESESRAIAEQSIQASIFLRPAQDDYLTDYRYQS